MKRATSVPTRAAAVRVAAARPAALVALLVLIAFLGMSIAPSSAAMRDPESLPPASGSRDPAGEGHQDTAESEQSAPARTERTGREPQQPLTRTGLSGERVRVPYAGRCAPVWPPRAPVTPRCVVLRC
ncbi:hypothetical protein CU044_1951 [Streptomyces sp. L-9-10]|uniref:hypothetical protein n=1 Tax=Streptomyces sp. L-9-10 TaxID=1478131 RepID=UPI00101DE41D|nr:hypothetical protein [Streptomyces sp. L-9-10]RYJ29482.1 hypothetical protein CU044_1951 [Streptomyces sp. L-9-10]